jgi:hypothetical protein
MELRALIPLTWTILALLAFPGSLPAADGDLPNMATSATVELAGPRGSDKHVYAHFMTWFKTRDFSGEWQMWNSGFEQLTHDPDVILDNGHRDAATIDYPLTGLYDSSDPDVVEYQFLLMKLAGIEGIIVDWNGRRISPHVHESLLRILPFLDRFGMKLIMCFEEWAGYWPRDHFPSHGEGFDAATSEVLYLMNEIASMPCYGVVRGAKPVLVFRKIPDLWYGVGEWERLAPVITSRGGGVLFDEGGYAQLHQVSDGKYFWIGDFPAGKSYSTLAWSEEAYNWFLENKTNGPARVAAPMFFGSVFPGFNDTPVWGWSGNPRIGPRYDGKRFEKMWEMSIAANLDLVQVVTWNDWNEGTQIEPADTYGFKYLEITKRRAAEYRGEPDKVPDTALRLPLKLFNARKAAATAATSESATLALDRVRDLLLDGSFDEAAVRTDAVLKKLQPLASSDPSAAADRGTSNTQPARNAED